MPGPALGLARILALLQHLGDPQVRTPVIHVAGTNGKGSICAYLDCIFRHVGLRTGRFNSPHLVQPRDSVLLDGEPVSAASFTSATKHVDKIDAERGTQASPFERLTATAFHLFAEARPKLDLAVVEVGLGGELDATNVFPAPLATILAPVDLDHQALLGDTVEAIAAVKCGIFKAGRPAIVAPQKHASVVDVAFERAKQLGSPCYLAESGTWRGSEVELPSMAARTYGPPLLPADPLLAHLSLAGSYQAANASTALLAARIVSSLYPQLAVCDQDAFRRGLEATTWPGRLSWVDLPANGGRPALRVLADGAHNPSAAVVLRSHLASLPPRRRTTYVLALSSPRDPLSILQPLLADGRAEQRVRVIATSFSTPVEGMPWISPQSTETIAEAARSLGVDEVDIARDVGDALARCDDGDDELVVVAGSLYLVADLYRLQRGSRCSGGLPRSGPSFSPSQE
jgi:folylpolyglutamate synthase